LCFKRTPAYYETMVTIISLGGSIVAPSEPDADFLKSFKQTLSLWLNSNSENKVILIVGGGGPARNYQKALQALEANPKNDDLDWLGIMATRLNAELVRALMESYCKDPVVYDPSGNIEFKGQVLVAAGWKPGFSTDFDSVYLAERFGAKTVINLSNIAQVYTEDPKKNPEARPLDHLSWTEFRKMVGDTWAPGANTPFDPIASKKAETLGLKIICASGRDLENLNKILGGSDFLGTTIN